MKEELNTKVWDVLTTTVVEVLPECNKQTIAPSQTLKALGANSIDRVEIIILVLKSLNLKIPLIEFAQAQNLKDLVNIFSEMLER